VSTLQVFDQLIARCRDLPRTPFAVVAPVTNVALSGAMEAAAAGLIEPILVGSERTIVALAAKLGVDLSKVQVIDAADDAAAARKAVAMCREGRAVGLMKGSLHTDVLMHAVLDHQAGLRTARRVSHVFVIDAPTRRASARGSRARRRRPSPPPRAAAAASLWRRWPSPSGEYPSEVHPARLRSLSAESAPRPKPHSPYSPDIEDAR